MTETDETAIVEIHGQCHPDFQPVRDMFANSFAMGLERGASVAVTLHGESVVDLWAGEADGAGRPWERDTIVNVWSTTKTMSVICLLVLADRGEIPESEEPRVGEIVPPTVGMEGVDIGLESLAARTLLSCPLTGAEPNSRAWRAAEIPAAGGTGNARSVARIHSALANGGAVDGVTILSPEGLERIFVEQIHDVDRVLGMKMRLGTGFGLMNDFVPLSPNPRSCFWGGWGGSIAVVDVDAELSVAYVMNRMADGLVGDLRGASLVLAAYQSLAL